MDYRYFSRTGVLVSPVRLRFDYELARAADGTALAHGHTVHASLRRDGRPCRLPARARDLFDASGRGPAA